MEAFYPYAIKNQLGARVFLRWGLWMGRAGSLWHKRHWPSNTIKLSTNESGPHCSKCLLSSVFSGASARLDQARATGHQSAGASVTSSQSAWEETGTVLVATALSAARTEVVEALDTTRDTTQVTTRGTTLDTTQDTTRYCAQCCPTV